MTYDELKEAIGKGAIVYGITEDDVVVSGKVVSVRSYREVLSANVFSDNPEIVENAGMYIVIRQRDGNTYDIKEAFSSEEEAKNSLSKKVEGEIVKLLDKANRLKLVIDKQTLLLA